MLKFHIMSVKCTCMYLHIVVSFRNSYQIHMDNLSLVHFVNLWSIRIICCQIHLILIWDPFCLSLVSPFSTVNICSDPYWKSPVRFILWYQPTARHRGLPDIRFLYIFISFHAFDMDSVQRLGLSGSGYSSPFVMTVVRINDILWTIFDFPYKYFFVNNNYVTEKIYILRST